MIQALETFITSEINTLDCECALRVKEKHAQPCSCTCSKLLPAKLTCHCNPAGWAVITDSLSYEYMDCHVRRAFEDSLKKNIRISGLRAKAGKHPLIVTGDLLLPLDLHLNLHHEKGDLRASFETSRGGIRCSREQLRCLMQTADDLGRESKRLQALLVPPESAQWVRMDSPEAVDAVRIEFEELFKQQQKHALERSQARRLEVLLGVAMAKQRIPDVFDVHVHLCGPRARIPVSDEDEVFISFGKLEARTPSQAQCTADDAKLFLSFSEAKIEVTDATGQHVPFAPFKVTSNVHYTSGLVTVDAQMEGLQMELSPKITQNLAADLPRTTTGSLPAAEAAPTQPQLSKSTAVALNRTISSSSLKNVQETEALTLQKFDIKVGLRRSTMQLHDASGAHVFFASMDGASLDAKYHQKQDFEGVTNADVALQLAVVGATIVHRDQDVLIFKAGHLGDTDATSALMLDFANRLTEDSNIFTLKLDCQPMDVVLVQSFLPSVMNSMREVQEEVSGGQAASPLVA